MVATTAIRNTIPNNYCNKRGVYTTTQDRFAIIMREVGRNIISHGATDATIWGYVDSDEYHLVVSSNSRGFDNLAHMEACCKLGQSGGDEGYSGIGIKGAAILIAPTEDTIGMGLVSQCLDGTTQYVYMAGEFRNFQVTANPLLFCRAFDKALGTQSDEVSKFTVHNVFRTPRYDSKRQASEDGSGGVVLSHLIRYAIGATPEIFEKVKFKALETPVGVKVGKTSPVAESLADMFEGRVKDLTKSSHAGKRYVNRVMPRSDFESLYSIFGETIEVERVEVCLDDEYNTQAVFDGYVKIVWYPGFYLKGDILQPIRNFKGMGYESSDCTNFRKNSQKMLTTLTFDIDNAEFDVPGKNLQRVKEDPVFFSSSETGSFMMEMGLPICSRVADQELMDAVMKKYPLYYEELKAKVKEMRPCVRVEFKMTRIHSLTETRHGEEVPSGVPVNLNTVQRLAGMVNDFLITESKHHARKVVYAIIAKAIEQQERIEELRRLHRLLFPVSDESEFLPLDYDEDDGTKGTPNKVPPLMVYVKDGARWVEFEGLLSPGWVRTVKLFDPKTKKFCNGDLLPQDGSCTINHVKADRYNLDVSTLRKVDDDGGLVSITREQYDRNSLPKRLIYVNRKTFRILPNVDVPIIASTGGEGGSKPGPKKAQTDVYVSDPEHPKIIAYYVRPTGMLKPNRCNVEWVQKLFGFRDLPSNLAKEVKDLYIKLKKSLTDFMSSGVLFEDLKIKNDSEEEMVENEYGDLYTYVTNRFLEATLSNDTEITGDDRKKGLITKIMEFKQKYAGRADWTDADGLNGSTVRLPQED